MLIIPSFIPFNTTIPIATLLAAMPTPVITSLQYYYFQFFLSHLCVLNFFIFFMFTNLDKPSQTLLPTAVTGNTLGCQWFHKHQLSLKTRNQFPTCIHHWFYLPVSTLQFPLCGLHSDWLHHLLPSNRAPLVGQQVFVIICYLKALCPHFCEAGW